MAEETQSAPQSRRGGEHAVAANPEQHLQEAHNLSIQIQGKEGAWGRAKWALVRQEQGKVKTLSVFEGTRLEAVNHFYKFIHPNQPAAPAAPAHRPSGASRLGPRPRQSQGRPARS
ncbi:MAG: hypothetical protein ACOX87_15535 [Chloroflexota bacterium]